MRHEERNLPQCLAALGGFASILVVDSGSTDRTDDIAREHGAQNLQFEWNGQCPEKRIVSGSVREIATPIFHRGFRGIAKLLEGHIDHAKRETAAVPIYSRAVPMRKNS